MTPEEIQRIIEANQQSEKHFKISFKKRDAVYGRFISCNDAENLRSKNFWRIVSFPNLTKWSKTKDINLSRIYHGSDFSRITLEN